MKRALSAESDMYFHRARRIEQSDSNGRDFSKKVCPSAF